MGRWRILSTIDFECQERAELASIEAILLYRGDTGRQCWLNEPEVTKAQILRQPQQPLLIYNNVVEYLESLSLTLENLVTIYSERVSAYEFVYV